MRCHKLFRTYTGNLPAWQSQISHFFKFHFTQENGSILLQNNIKLQNYEDYWVIETWKYILQSPPCSVMKSGHDTQFFSNKTSHAIPGMHPLKCQHANAILKRTEWSYHKEISKWAMTKQASKANLLLLSF